MNITENVINTGLVEVNYNTIETHLEPYIGWKFKIIKKGRRVSSINWFGKVKKVDNHFLNFA